MKTIGPPYSGKLNVRWDGKGMVKSHSFTLDILVHCYTKSEAEQLLEAIKQRLGDCRLELSKEKSKIVYCKDSNRKAKYPEDQFDFLGYTFRPRLARNKRGEFFVSFTPAASKRATKSMRSRLKLWKLHRHVSKSVEEIAEMINPVLRGWINYYGKYYPSELVETFSCLNRRLAKWASRKFKNMRARKRRAGQWLEQLAKLHPTLFAHWELLNLKSFHW